MRYIVTGVDGQLGKRIAENMLSEVPGSELTFTADLDPPSPDSFCILS